MESKPAANGGNVQKEDGHTAEEEEGVVSIKEYVEGLEAQELEVDMILGGDDGKECTYPKGYLPRQAVFSCISCCPEGDAGVCTACSMSCHDGHEVIEIWTRRHFRCDCGNSKFGTGVCRLFSNKDTENSENVYNQNFKGVYCTCKRPYPDPDAGEETGEMLQCCICEDWFHEDHLGLAPAEEVPRDEDSEPLFDELICQACGASLDFLSHYKELLVPVISTSNPHQKEELSDEVKPDPAQIGSEVILNETVDVCETSGVFGDLALKASVRITPSEEVSAVEEGSTLRIEDKVSTSVIALDACQPQQADISVKEHSEKLLTNGGVAHSNGADSMNPGQLSAFACKLKSGEASGSVKRGEQVSGDDISKCGDGQSTTSSVWANKALFLAKNWRSQLCRCDACWRMCVEKGVSFLMDSEDTISKYEEVAKQKRKEKMDATGGHDLAFLNSMSHVGKIEFLHGLNEMTTELSAFFASCESGKAITSDEIYEFFDNLKKKRARLE
eukprot:c22220_g7_i1 orf=194-1696(+)